MTAPADFLSDLELEGKPTPEQVKRMKERAAELQKQRSWAVLSMLGTPEMQAAGRAQFEEAGRQQGALEQMAPAVLNRALAREHLSLERGQQALQWEALRTGNVLAQQREVREAYAPFLKELMEQGGKAAVIKKWMDVFGVKNSFLQKLMTMNPSARVEHATELMKERGAAPPPIGAPLVPGGPATPEVPGATVNPLHKKWEQKYEGYPKKKD